MLSSQGTFYFPIFEQNSGFGSPKPQDDLTISFTGLNAFYLGLKFQEFSTREYDLFVSANSMDLPTNNYQRLATWAYHNKTFIEVDNSSQYDNNTQTLTVNGETIPVVLPIFFGTESSYPIAATYFGGTYGDALTQIASELDGLPDKSYLYLHHGPFAPVIVRDDSGKQPSNEQPYLQKLLAQATAYYRTNLIFSLDPGLATAFYDTKNGGEPRSIMFPRWDLQQCENVSVLGVSDQKKIVTAERPDLVDPKSPFGLTRAQLDSWCATQNCTSTVPSATCVSSGGGCTGRDASDIHCEELISAEDPENSKDCLANPYCTITLELEDKVGVRLNDFVLVSSEEQQIAGGWQYYCRPFTQKIELNFANANDLFKQNKLPLLQCESEEECRTPPENFLGLPGTDSFNMRTTLKNEFWINYFINFPMFGESPFAKVKVTNLGNSTGIVDAFIRSNGLESLETKCDSVDCVSIKEGLPNCGPGDTLCSYLIDDIFLCPCDREKRAGWPSCAKPLTQFYTPDMFAEGSSVYASLYDLGSDVWPSYQSCPVFSIDDETRDIPQFLQSQLTDERVIKPGARPEQLHYCDKINGHYGYCKNDKYTLAERIEICEQKYGNVGVKGKTVHTIDSEELMCHGDTCVVMHGPGTFGSVPSVLYWIKQNKKPYRNIKVASLSQQFLKLVLFDAETYDTVFSANYSEPVNKSNAFTANQIDIQSNTLFRSSESICGASKSIVPVLNELKRYYDYLNRFNNGRISLVTADKDYAPDDNDFMASLSTAQAEGFYTENGATLEDNFVIESFFDDLWPTFQLSGDTCLAFSVVGENVVLRNLKFDKTLCTPKPGYGYQQIPIVCPGPSCAKSRFENLLVTPRVVAPVIGFLGASGVDGRDGATAVAEVDVANVIIENVTGSRYVVAAARSVGAFAVELPSKDDCNVWAALPESCREPSADVFREDDLPVLKNSTTTLTDNGYLISNADDETVCATTLTRDSTTKLVFGSCENKEKFITDPYLHLIGEPFYCVNKDLIFEPCVPCHVGFLTQHRPSRFVLPPCQKLNYDITLLSNTTINTAYYCGIDILSCTDEQNRDPHGAATSLSDSAVTLGIGAVITDGSIAKTIDHLSIGGFGYSELLDTGVAVDSVLIEPNDPSFEMRISDPSLAVINVTFYTSLFGKNYLNLVYAVRPLATTFYIFNFIALAIILLILVALNILIAEQISYEQKGTTGYMKLPKKDHLL